MQIRQFDTIRRCKTVSVLLILLLLAGCEQSEPALEVEQHASQGTMAAAISDDARFAVVATVNSGSGYWDLIHNKLLFHWTQGDSPDNAVVAADISADGKRAITADRRNFVIWNTSSGKAYGYWQAPADIRDVAISNLGRYVLLGLGDGRAIHIDMKTGRRLEFTGHRQEAVASVDLSANGLWCFTAGNDYRAILWNSKTGKPKRLFELETRAVKAVLAPSGKLAFTAGTLGNAKIWDLERSRLITRLSLKKREYVISAARFSHDEKLIATGAPGRFIKLWTTADGKLMRSLKARTRNQGKPSGAIIYALAFSADDRFLWSESSAGYGEKWPVQAPPK